MKKYLTMSELEALGFEVVKSYENDQYKHTQRRQKGCITIETTWLKTGAFVSQEVKIEKEGLTKINPFTLRILDKILNI
jgi:hypothetical protein